MEVQIKPWGNSLGIRLPKSVLKEAGLQPDDTLIVQAQDGRLIMCRSCKHKTLEERAAAYGGSLHLDSELDWKGEPMGNEVW